MADNKTGLNAQYDPGNSLFGTAVPSNSGAPGSPGVTSGEVDATLANPVVSVPGASSQVPASMPTAPVGVGDTSAFSDDVPVHKSPLLPADPSAYLSTGAGQGSDITAGHHPNARA